MTSRSQPGILDEVPTHARMVWFRLACTARPADVRGRLAGLALHDDDVLGIGVDVVALLGGDVPGLRPFPHLSGPGVHMPATGGALWLWARGTDPGALLHRVRLLQKRLAGPFVVEQTVDAFRYLDGRDLSGYVDGTENPTGARARDVAIVRGAGPGLDGSSFVSVQTWVHGLDALEALSEPEQDAIIGRRRSDNEEIDDAPPSAHVKRTAQEDFTPEAFVVRRSMPWADATREGLVFIAFGARLDPFEALARRMVGLDDGIVDGLFRFTRPVTGGHFWCPPRDGAGLDLVRLAPA